MFFLLLRIIGGSTGGLAAPLLFLTNATNGKLFRIHAPPGKRYVGAIGGACVGGFYVNQFVEKGGLVSQLAFAVQFAAWGGATRVAYRKIRARRVISHSLRIVRSVALTASFLTYALGWSFRRCLARRHVRPAPRLQCVRLAHLAGKPTCSLPKSSFSTASGSTTTATPGSRPPRKWHDGRNAIPQYKILLKKCCPLRGANKISRI